MKRQAMLAAALLAATGSVTAHDFWIEPATFRPGPSQHAAVMLCEGDAFEGVPLPRDADRIARFVSRGPAGEAPILGRDGRWLAGIARFPAPGTYVLGYESDPSTKDIEAWQFEPYLAEKGLDRIIELRRARGATHRGAREAYSRYAKALVRAGEGADAADTQPLGLRLELVPESSLATAARPDAYSFRLLFDGKALAGALVTATARRAPEVPLRARTDDKGRVRYKLSHAGEWLLTVVHMIEAAPGRRAQWESFWGSLSFQIADERSAMSRASQTLNPCAS